MERTRYFAGRLLGVEDFQREQDWLIARSRRHNRFAHGWGVLHGLDVTLDGANVVVSPGLAIDCEGNEIELTSPQAVAIAAGGSAVLHVGLRYVEVPIRPLPGGGFDASDSDDGGGGVEPGAIRESAEVVVVPANACAGHARLGPGTPGCGQRHEIVLVRLVPRGGVWQVRRARCAARRRR